MNRRNLRKRISSLSLCVCVCVCVCERESERERLKIVSLTKCLFCKLGTGPPWQERQCGPFRFEMLLCRFLLFPEEILFLLGPISTKSPKTFLVKFYHLIIPSRDPTISTMLLGGAREEHYYDHHHQQMKKETEMKEVLYLS